MAKFEVVYKQTTWYYVEVEARDMDRAETKWFDESRDDPRKVGEASEEDLEFVEINKIGD